MTGPAALVIGVGNDFRADDGVGPAVVAALTDRSLPGVEVTISDGEPSQLLELWAGVPLAVVVDAVLCEPSRPGRIHDTTLATVPGARAASGSTHGLGIPEAYLLAEALDLAPQRLVVFAVEAADVGFGVGLTPAVAAAVPEVVERIVSTVSPRENTEEIRLNLP
jgi:hydrogenase maturation protease